MSNGSVTGRKSFVIDPESFVMDQESFVTIKEPPGHKSCKKDKAQLRSRKDSMSSAHDDGEEGNAG